MESRAFIKFCWGATVQCGSLVRIKITAVSLKLFDSILIEVSGSSCIMGKVAVVGLLLDIVLITLRKKLLVVGTRRTGSGPTAVL